MIIPPKVWIFVDFSLLFATTREARPILEIFDRFLTPPDSQGSKYRKLAVTSQYVEQQPNLNGFNSGVSQDRI